MLPPFPTQTEEIKFLGKHCTTGIDLRISNERVILLDTKVRLSYFLFCCCNPNASTCSEYLGCQFVKRYPFFALQPVYSPSLLIDMMRPDGSSTIPVLNGDPLSADLAHELMGIQVNTILQLLNLVVLLLIHWATPNH